MLRANNDGRDAYADMVRSDEYRHPVRWSEAGLDGVDALLLPGGHRARGMRNYIDSDILQQLVVDAFARDIGGGRDLSRRAAGRAQCRSRHGALGALRTQDHRADMVDGRSRLAAHPVTRFWDPDYYRTYSEEPGQPGATCRCSPKSLERCVRRRTSVMSDRSPHRWLKSSGMVRDTATDSRAHSSSTTATTCRRAGPAIPTPLRVWCPTSSRVRPSRPSVSVRRRTKDTAPRVVGRGLVITNPAMRSSGWAGKVFAKLCPTPG